MTYRLLSRLFCHVAIGVAPVLFAGLPGAAAPIDLTGATVVTGGNHRSVRVAATVLAEEITKRTGLEIPAGNEWPDAGPVVIVTSGAVQKVHGISAPDAAAGLSAEGYCVATFSDDRPIVWIAGADARGALFGVGYLLRKLEWREGTVTLPGPLSMVSAPEYPLRGHQLGYRATANSYDAWSIAQYDQYIRELAFFGTNAIEMIPLQDDRPLVGDVPRDEMDRAVSAICDKYGLDFWIWTPATVDLNDAAARSALLSELDALLGGFKRLDAVFFPGGDPGDNPPELVMPFLEDVSTILAKHHPKAKIWISLQGFDHWQVDVFYEWMAEHQPDWMGGVVAGPSSPAIYETRLRLDRRYGLRHYPDITHVVRAQYPVSWIDPAFAFTLGREPVNPRPVYYRMVHNNLAPYTNGFLTYSDGIHDDANKIVWSALGWDTTADLRDVLTDYCRVFFGPEIAETAADGIFALENNWNGALARNGSVDGTLRLWQELEAKSPQLSENWRWNLYLLRAYYDAYVRHRLIHESSLEEAANTAMLKAPVIGADASMDAALAELARVDAGSIQPGWRDRIYGICETLFQTIGYQTSVEKYGAIAPERGAVLDFVDYPLNNRWWLEDEIAKARQMSSEEAKVAHLNMLATWENPGPGSFYDDIGNVAQCDRVITSEASNTLLEPDRPTVPDFMFWDSGKRRVRQSWMSKMDWPEGLRYIGLDPNADYVFKTTGVSSCLPRANGIRLVPTVDGREVGEIKEFPVPRQAYREGYLTITFDVPFEPGINWRQMSRLSEAWLIKK